jgi:cytochrome c biogenesis protein CcmG/thiol:disulfide interchange protein DsbE
MNFKLFLGCTLFAAAAIGVSTLYLRAVHGTVSAERAGSCSILKAEPLEQQAPDFELADLGGKRQRLSGLRGKVVLLNFWATWCPPCIEEIPSLLELRQAMRGKAFELVTVSVDEDVAALKAFLGKHLKDPSSLPVLSDPQKKSSTAFGTEKFPESYLIDKSGVARFKFIYKRDWASREAQGCIESLL